MIYIILIFLIVILISFLFYYGLIKEKSLENNSNSYTLRFGKSTKTDSVFKAWTTGDLNAMLNVVNTPTNPIDRHFLLQSIVNSCYINRKSVEYRIKLREFAEVHISEFPIIAQALKSDMQGQLPRVTTFQQYSTVLTEDSEYNKAIEVCKIAINYGLKDGTKGGFEGRIKRIEKLI